MIYEHIYIYIIFRSRRYVLRAYAYTCGRSLHEARCRHARNIESMIILRVCAFTFILLSRHKSVEFLSCGRAAQLFHAVNWKRKSSTRGA